MRIHTAKVEAKDTVKVEANGGAEVKASDGGGGGGEKVEEKAGGGAGKALLFGVSKMASEAAEAGFRPSLKPKLSLLQQVYEAQRIVRLMLKTHKALLDQLQTTLTGVPVRRSTFRRRRKSMDALRKLIHGKLTSVVPFVQHLQISHHGFTDADIHHAITNPTKLHWKMRLYLLLEVPRSSKLARVINGIIFLVVIMSILAFCLETTDLK